MVPNDPSDDREALRSFALLQHVRSTSGRSDSHHLYHLVFVLAVILVRYVWVSDHQRHSCLHSQNLRYMRRVPPHSTLPKISNPCPLPILLDARTVGSHKTPRVYIYADVHSEVGEGQHGSGSKLRSCPMVGSNLQTADGLNIVA